MTVGPHPLPWPDDPRLDPELFAEGDTRNVEDRFRYWRREAIIAELDSTRHPVHIAIENFQHDFNIGSVAYRQCLQRGRRAHRRAPQVERRRGAMVTDRYQHVEHHSDPAGLLDLGLPIIGIDNIEGSTAIERRVLPVHVCCCSGRRDPGSATSHWICARRSCTSRNTDRPVRSMPGRRRDRHVRLALQHL